MQFAIGEYCAQMTADCQLEAAAKVNSSHISLKEQCLPAVQNTDNDDDDDSKSVFK